jgi:glutamate-ammonia-ligase adenylyltransferase
MAALIRNTQEARRLGKDIGITPGQSGEGDAVLAAMESAPYLARLAARRPDMIQRLVLGEAKSAASDCVAQARAAATLENADAVMTALRKAKADLHLALAIGDLAGALSLEEVTVRLASLADAALETALQVGVRRLAATSEMEPSASETFGPAPGFMLIAMGKHGARELNYSSDIDFSVFFDGATFPVGPRGDGRATPVRLAQAIVRILEEVTPDGYVFRTDLRLRPDPGATPIAVSVASAEHYYQTLGQNWERAAFIKARACAGDVAAGTTFLAELAPFIWRKNLDYAAIADVHSIKRQILAANKSADLDDPVFDLKLGRGGVRDIELFVQTQQLIVGGRDRSLRAPDTLGALGALCAAGVIDETARRDLTEAYIFLRMVEHRVQMRLDEQTHRIPNDAGAQADLAALCGYHSFADLGLDVCAHRHRVAEIDAQLFRNAAPLGEASGSLVFTGVDDDPDTIETLVRMGYKAPDRVSAAIRAWHHGRIRATRSPRARELLTALMPTLLRVLSQSGDPDGAFEHFDDFFFALPAGVEVLSRLSRDGLMLEEVCRALALAPALSKALSSRPVLLDAMAERRFRAPLKDDAPGARHAHLDTILADVAGFEPCLNAARRYQREEAFRIGMAVLMGRASAAEAGPAYADLADACVACMAKAAGAEMQRVHGAIDGDVVVLGLGKFGGQELSAGADLDMMLIYDAPPEAQSDGARPLLAGEYFAKLTQRLISALSAPTEEGVLYEVDMQLRPSGSKGPVAVRMAAFAHYYAKDAWTWELQALTRARVICGAERLSAQVMAVVRTAIVRPRARDSVRADVAEMRARLLKEKPARSFWDLKLALGGLIDLEFIAQYGLLTHPSAPHCANSGKAFDVLVSIGALTAPEGQALINAHRLYSDLQHAVRVCLPLGADPGEATPAVKAVLARAAGMARFADVEVAVKRAQARVREMFAALVADAGDGSADNAR